jgi:hypothetical protein
MDLMHSSVSVYLTALSVVRTKTKGGLSDGVTALFNSGVYPYGHFGPYAGLARFRGFRWLLDSSRAFPSKPLIRD